MELNHVQHLHWRRFIVAAKVVAVSVRQSLLCRGQCNRSLVVHNYAVGFDNIALIRVCWLDPFPLDHLRCPTRTVSRFVICVGVLLSALLVFGQGNNSDMLCVFIGKSCEPCVGSLVYVGIARLSNGRPTTNKRVLIVR
ncbi:MAG: hypothetical protein ACI9HK_004041 [Pirellulaceae bacterium]|jgi:hypothetical protein